MNKLLQFFDRHVLKIGVAFAILFTALYPKLPSIYITHTWVYVRLEDFLIGILFAIWIVQLARKKVSLPFPIAWSFVIYWIIGGSSLIFSLIFIGPHLANFFPKLAVLEYLRRIEYMILFFIAFSTIKSSKDIKDYFITLCTTLVFIDLYGLGQKFYLFFWHAFPKFFEKYPFCFPSFQTGNEQFAKGLPLCLIETSRITSTFGGHYDLAAYLVVTIPILIAVFIILKKWYVKVPIALLAIISLMLLVLTSSRTSYAAYLVGVVAMLVIFKKKMWIIPITLVSIAMLFVFSGGTLTRLSQLITPVFVISGKKTGSITTTLPADLQKQINKTKEIEETQSQQTLPPGTVVVGPPAQASPISSASGATQVLTPGEAEKLKLLSVLNGNVAISTQSGSFLIQKAYALDISFTTRFQAEWPRDWMAFIKSPVFGTGYSSLTLASDNDYLRALGETGLLGLLSFMAIFLMLGIFLREAYHSVKDDISKAFLFGLSGGMIGLFLNAVLIDVFEASKVAEPLWIFLGISTGILYLHYKKSIDYRVNIQRVLTSNLLIAIYFLVSLFVFFGQTLSQFFVGDDFTWLKWAASSTVNDIPQYFLNAEGFFYRPFAKVLMYYLYMIFSFQPQGYHLFNLFLHCIVTFGVYLLVKTIIKNKFIAFISALLFFILPMHQENLFWISTMSINLSAVFLIYGLLCFIEFRKKNNTFLYLLTWLCAIASLLSYEGAIIFPFLLMAVDIFITKPKNKAHTSITYLPFILFSLLYIAIRPVVHALQPSGDYSYNLSHLVPNLFGNIVGYWSLFLFGEHAIPLYQDVRNGLKVYSFIITIVLILLIITALISWFIHKKRIIHVYTNSDVSIVVFSFIFSIAALLPFLGLGNMTERYGYLASVGFVLLIAYVLKKLGIFFKENKTAYYITIIAITCILSLWYSIDLQKESNNWSYTSKLTYMTLLAFRVNYPTMPQYTVLYFANVPIKYGEAWIFPWGLSDGLWFIYRDPTIKVIQTKTIKEAKEMRSNLEKNSLQKTYIFSFNDKGTVSEVQ